MRIISGKFKGQSIKFLKNKKTRPLKDSVKENIFNILEHSNIIKVKIKNSNILDLYSGVGSFGIECISREADKVIFVEHDPQALNLLRTNLKNLSFLKSVEIINDTIANFFALKHKEKYHIFFFDPPFADKEYITYLKILKISKNFFKNHIVIVHRDKRSDDILNDCLNVKLVKVYGRSKIIFATFN